MAAFLSQEWLDAQAAASAARPEVPGLDARIQLVVPGGPDGERKVTTVVADGRITGSTLGAEGEADLTLTITHGEAVQLAQGELDPNAAFIRGRIKVVGSTGLLLRLLAATKDPAYEAMRADLAATTDF